MTRISMLKTKETEEFLSSLKDKLNIYRQGKAEDLIEVELSSDEIAVDCEEIDFGKISDALRCDGNKSDYKDAENVEILHGMMKDLPASVAAKSNMWAYYAHAYFADYVRYRSECAGNESVESVGKDYFCSPTQGRDIRRTLLVNPLSRLWWVGRLLRDESQQDPYHYVKLIRPSEFASFVMLLGSTTAVSNPTIAHAIFGALETWKKLDGEHEISRQQLVACTKYLNRVGAIKMIDMLSTDELRKMLVEKLKNEFPSNSESDKA